MVNEKKAMLAHTETLALAVARHMPRQNLIGEWSRLAAEPISSDFFLPLLQLFLLFGR